MELITGNAWGFVETRPDLIFVERSRREPGDIDNSSLIDKSASTNNRVANDDCVQLKSGLVHRTNFEMVPELLWLFLRKYYRCNGAVVCRKVTYRKKLNKPELDLYPVSITLLFVYPPAHSVSLLSSSQSKSIVIKVSLRNKCRVLRTITHRRQRRTTATIHIPCTSSIHC